jgi:hypothetical protein
LVRCRRGASDGTPAVVRFLRHRDTPAELGWIPVSKLKEWEKGLETELLTDDNIIELWLKGDRVGAVREYRRSHSLGLKSLSKRFKC